MPSADETVDRRFPIGANQKRFILAERFSDACYMISVVHRVEGSFDVARFRRAASDLVLRHDALRSEFQIVSGEYRAGIRPTPDFQFHVIELADDDFETFRSAALPLIMTDIDVTVVSSLVRFIIGRVVGKDSWRVCFASHHAISDGVSRALAIKQLFQLYDGQDLPDCASYYSFVGLDRSLDAPQAFWTQRMSQAPAETQVQPDREPTSETSLGEFAQETLDVSALEFRQLTKRVSSSQFSCLAAAYAIGLTRMTGSARTLFTFQSAGRNTVGAPGSVFGPFSNTLPLVAEVDPSASFAELVKSMKAETGLALANETLPFDRILRLLPRLPEYSLNAFPKELPPTADGLQIFPREFLDRPTEYALNLVWSQDGDEMVCRGYFDGGRFSRARIQDFLRAQKILLQAAMHAPDAPIRDLLDRLSGVTTALPERYAQRPARTVIDHVVSRAEAHPDVIAIRTSGGQISYADLLHDADRVAAALLLAGLRPGDRVVLVARRSPDLVAAVLGAARSGASFAVLDAAYPQERLRQQIDVLRPRFAIALDPQHDGWLTDVQDVALVRLGTGKLPAISAFPGLVPGAPLYFLFTSGTTGVPKCIGHGPEILTFYVDWAIAEFSVDPSDCVTMLSGLNHDPVMRDIFVSLASGASLAIPDEDEFGDPRKLRAFLRDVGATIVHLTPPLGRLLAMQAADEPLTAVRLLVWGGDELPGKQVRLFRQLAPSAVQVNLYGTSETPQAAALYVVPADDPATWLTTPIGTTVDWMRCDCVTADGRICGTGEMGQLRVAMPFPTFAIPGGGAGDRPGDMVESRVHATGDRAFVLPDGQFVFAGRQDDQVKIRGYRVELREIAAAMRAMPEIGQAIALTDRKPDGTQRIVAYCEPVGGKHTDASAVRRALKRRLPEYMVPEQIHVLDRMPLLPNGKIDRHALAAVASTVEPVSAEKAASERRMSADESRIAALFEKVSGSKVTDARRSLIDLGADSLSVIEARLTLEGNGCDLPEGWEELPIAALAGLLPRAGDGGSGWIRFANLETFIVMRGVAIFLVVALHMHWFGFGGGATSLLFVIAGLTFAKFMARPILEDGRTRKIWILLAKILVTSLPVMVLVFVVQLLLGNPAHLSTIGFYSNWLSHSKYPPGVPDDGRLVWLWYIHCYFQVFLFLAILFSFKSVRRTVAADPFRATMISLVVSVAAFAGAAAYVGAFESPARPMTPLALSPLLGLILVLLGIGTALASNTRERVVLLCGALLVAAMKHALFTESNAVVLFIGVLILMFLPSVRLPGPVARVLTIISGGSLYIYLMHNPLRFLVVDVADIAMHPGVLTVATIAVSLLLWRLWQPVLRFINDWGGDSRRLGPVAAAQDEL